MRYSRLLSILIVCLVSLAGVSGVSANWYAGNVKASGFGVFAKIWSPASAPNIAWVTPPGHSGEASWVAATNPSATVFVQAGWLYFPFDGVTPAKSYTEGKQDNLHWLKYYAVQPWNTVVKYTVENNPMGGSC